MIKEMLMTAVISATAGGATVGGTMKFYADHVYESQVQAAIKHDELAAQIVATNAAIQKESNKQRIKQLNTWIEQTYRNAELKGRDLTRSEQNDVRKWETEITEIKGW